MAESEKLRSMQKEGEFVSQLTMKKLQAAGVTGLLSTTEAIKRLGEHGREKISINQFGEGSLRADKKAEKVILDYLKSLDLPIRVISEEHGQVDITDKPKFLAILDGLDGSGNYARNQGRYGTMLSIFANLDPIYCDYVFAGIMEHTSGRLFYATKDKGAFVVEGGKVVRMRTSGKRELNGDAKIYVDKYFDLNKQTFAEPLEGQGFETEYLGSSAVYYADVASGAADLALECTRKRNLEIVTAYGLLHETGGAMVDLDGNDLGEQKYSSFGQDEHVPVVTAATPDLATDLLARIKI